MEKLIVSTSPHVHQRVSTTSVMRDLLIALSPVTVAAIVLFGAKAALIIALCVGTSVVSELLFCILSKRPSTISDLSAAVTGLLLALNLSTNVTVWQCIVGSAFAIIIVKCAFGGLGRNFANPAITARVMLLIAFSDVVAGGAETNFMLKAGATPLAVMKDGVGTLPSMIDMLLGNRGGAIGETCAVALLLGGIYLLVRRVITWHVPVVYVGGVFLLSLLMKQDLNVALYQIMGGGLLIGAIFMATDYVTTPKRKLGKVVFAAGCAILTVLIRFYGSYPEGVSFAILIMNILTPYIDMLVSPKNKGGAQS